MRRILLSLAALLLLFSSIMLSRPEGSHVFTAAIPFGSDSITMSFHTGPADKAAAVGIEEYRRTAIPPETEGKIYIPDSISFMGNMTPIKWISRGAFQFCPGITEVRLPKYLRSISDLAFEGCTSLREITIPDSVVWLFPSAFSGCSNLRRVRFLPLTPPRDYNPETFDKCVYATATLVIPAQSSDAYLHDNVTFRFRYHAEVLPLYPGN